MLHRHTTFDRRRLMQSAGLGLLGASASGWFPSLAAALADDPRRRRHCVLLWMNGGPSQTDTFDMKPGHANGGPIEEHATSVPGLRFSEHLPALAAQADRLAVIRSLTTKEGDHSRATHLIRTGHAPGESVRFPSIACALAKELRDESVALPNYVGVTPRNPFNPAAFGPGFLGPQFAPAIVGSAPADQGVGGQGFADLEFKNLEMPPGVTTAQAQRRWDMWRMLQQSALGSHRAQSLAAHNTVYERALALTNGDARGAFDLEQEPRAVREAYGRGRFGQGCLLARRLIERGVAFVEVALGEGVGWDTHQNNFADVQSLCEELNAGWGTLMRELDERGLLDDTTILWIGEFGRTPAINGMAGRDHFPNAWSCVFAGGGIQGGQAYGRTTSDGMEVDENGVGIGDVLATLCAALGVDPDVENVSEVGRPIPLAEGRPIDDILA